MRVRLVAPLYALVQLALWSLGCTYPQTHAAEAVESRSKFRIPEYILQNANIHHCTLKVSLLAPDTASRRRTVIAFIRTNYQKTDHWHRDFAIAGIDYAAYRYFYIVGFDDCVRLKRIPAILTLKEVKLSVDQSGQHLVGTLDEVRKHGAGLTAFIYYRSPKDISRCLLRISVDPAHETQTPILYRRILDLWMQYRLPLSDVTFGDNRIYVLFSRQCSAKKQIIMVGIRSTGDSAASLDLNTHLSREEIDTYAASQGVRLSK